MEAVKSGPGPIKADVPKCAQIADQSGYENCKNAHEDCATRVRALMAQKVFFQCTDVGSGASKRD